MSVWMWVYANHNVNFNTSIENIIEECLKRLNSLNLSKNQWYIEEISQMSELPRYRFQIEWKDDEEWFDVEITKTYIFFDTECFPWTHWYHPYDDSERQTRDFWIGFIHTVAKAFGADTVTYFPDNMFESHQYMPSEHPELDFQEVLDLLYSNHKFIFSSIEDANEADSGDPVIVEHI